MTQRAYRSLQALILAGTGIYLLSRAMEGRLLLYISQRFVPLVILGALGMLILAQVALRERPALDDQAASGGNGEGADHWHSPGNWSLWLLALPLLAGLLVPQRPLSASALETRGINLSAGFSAGRASNQAQILPPLQRSLLDWLRIFAEEADLRQYTGQEADVTGFVYHDPRLNEDSFLVSRFTIACCVADATAIGMVVNFPGSAELAGGQWVRVRGAIYTLEMAGRTVPAITARQVEVIQPPEQPYLFP
jgi:uncharacterized repeat protein (TIGR03943 family)